MQKVLASAALGTVADAMNYADLDALHAAIGEGHVSAQSVVQRLRPRAPRRRDEEQLPTTARSASGAPAAAAGRGRRLRRGPRRHDGAAVPVLHAGAGRRDHRLRHPGRGVSVHRADCANAAALVGERRSA